MLFNSIDFAIFLPIVFLIYWFGTGKSKRIQNIFVLIASYVFYGWWDWRFLSLLFLATLIDYVVGIQLGKSEDKKIRKFLIAFSITLNLSMLGIFKYFNFFIDNFVTAFSFFGVQINPVHIDVILPVGISFYTFQTMSYALDVYKNKLKPTSDFIAFASFVSFFPQLVAGPIERATNLLPQFYKRRTFEYAAATDGLRQILWGLFKKVVIADNCATYVDMVFGNITGYQPGTLIFAAMLFPLQVYGDFSGYSDIAIGTARLFGVNLHRNFAYPFFSKTVGEFWRRWHISLYTWFRDYIFLPHVFSSKTRSKWVIVRATFITFILIGFWHGADWSFVWWGIVNAIFIVIPIILERKRERSEFVSTETFLPDVKSVFHIIVTYHLIALAAIMFRVESMSQMWVYYKQIFTGQLFTLPQEVPAQLIYLIIVFQIIEWFGRSNQFGIQKTGLNWPVPVRWLFYMIIIFITGMFMESIENPFIYFNF